MPGEGQSAETSAREQLLLFREVTAEVVTALRSQEVTKSFVTITLEELVDRRLAELIDSDDPLRRSKRAAVEKVYQDFKGQIDAIRETDPTLFRRASESDTVNTAAAGEDSSV